MIEESMKIFSNKIHSLYISVIYLETRILLRI